MAHVLRGPSVFWALEWFWIRAHVFSGLGFWGFGSCFQRPRIFGSWLLFSEDQGCFGLWKGSGSRLMFLVVEDVGALAHVFRGLRVFWALAHVFRGPMVLDPGSCFQRPRIFGSWLMFSED